MLFHTAHIRIEKVRGHAVISKTKNNSNHCYAFIEWFKMNYLPLKQYQPYSHHLYANIITFTLNNNKRYTFSISFKIYKQSLFVLIPEFLVVKQTIKIVIRFIEIDIVFHWHKFRRLTEFTLNVLSSWGCVQIFCRQLKNSVKNIENS